MLILAKYQLSYQVANPQTQHLYFSTIQLITWTFYQISAKKILVERH